MPKLRKKKKPKNNKFISKSKEIYIFFLLKKEFKNSYFQRKEMPSTNVSAGIYKLEKV